MPILAYIFRTQILLIYWQFYWHSSWNTSLPQNVSAAMNVYGLTLERHHRNFSVLNERKYLCPIASFQDIQRNLYMSRGVGRDTWL